MLENYECKAFLKVANELGYQAAESFHQASKSDDSAEDESMKKRLEEVRKLYSGTSKNSGSQIRPKGHQQYQPNIRPQGYIGFPAQPVHFGGQVPPIQYGVAQPWQFHPQVYSAPPTAFGNYPQPSPQFNSFVGPKPVRGRFPRPPIDKRNSTCKACLSIGHWAGDPSCPLSGFPAPGPSQLALGGPGVMASQPQPAQTNLHVQQQQPPPPGSG